MTTLPDDQDRADQADQDISSVLAGNAAPSADPMLLWLAASMRPEVPVSVHRGVTAALASDRRSWQRMLAGWDAHPVTASLRAHWPVRVACAALGVLFVSQGVGNLVAGRWVARNADIVYSEHLFFESGLVLIAVGLLIGAGAVRRRWLLPAVWVGGPLGLAFGVHGAPELHEFAWGAALHLSQGVAALALVIAAWRYRRARRSEERA